MKIAIVGAKERDTDEDRVLVSALMEQIVAEAPHTVFVAALTHMGVGRYVKEKAIEQDTDGHYKFALIECSVRIFAQGLSKSDLAQIYLARNGTPYELSDMLIYLAAEDRRGTCEELLERFVQAGRPTLILMPGDPIPTSIVAGADPRVVV